MLAFNGVAWLSELMKPGVNEGTARVFLLRAELRVAGDREISAFGEGGKGIWKELLREEVMLGLISIFDL